MAFQSAADYVREYHNLKVVAVGPDGTPMAETVHITGYQTLSGELANLTAALRKVLPKEDQISDKELRTTTRSFHFPRGDVLGTVEPFFWQGLRRAYGFKGSPAEIHDALRLAYRCGRIGKGKDILGRPTAAPTMAVYAKRCFGLDCNGLVGNYYNLSPEFYIGSWGLLSQREKDTITTNVDKTGLFKGNARAEELTLSYLPLVPCRSVADIKDKGVLISVDETKKNPWPHIAIAEDMVVKDAKTNLVTIRIVEWGWPTEERFFETQYDTHIHAPKDYPLAKGTRKEFGLGIPNGTQFRYLFARPTCDFPPAGWGRCNQEDA
jgi:hypothetical protein